MKYLTSDLVDITNKLNSVLSYSNAQVYIKVGDNIKTLNILTIGFKHPDVLRMLDISYDEFQQLF